MDTATTEIDTYGHTLSLHDALPICPRAASSGSKNVYTADSARVPARSVTATPSNRWLPCSRNSRNRPCDQLPTRNWSNSKLPWSRSEEHTSELQSLMRISYAVFCLKKKQQRDPEHKIQKNRT